MHGRRSPRLSSALIRLILRNDPATLCGRAKAISDKPAAMPFVQVKVISRSGLRAARSVRETSSRRAELTVLETVVWVAEAFAVAAVARRSEE